MLCHSVIENCVRILNSLLTSNNELVLTDSCDGLNKYFLCSSRVHFYRQCEMDIIVKYRGHL